MTPGRATLIGFSAVLLWAALAYFTVGSAPVPPLLLNAICFTIGGTLGLIWTAASGELAVLKAVRLRVYLFGILGLFGYHALYFSALRMAPAAEAGLIAYLWPLLIVLLSSLLPGERLRAGMRSAHCWDLPAPPSSSLARGRPGLRPIICPATGWRCAAR